MLNNMKKTSFVYNIPLAWLQVSRERSRLLVAMAGIAFADMLMFIQLGFQTALNDITPDCMKLLMPI